MTVYLIQRPPPQPLAPSSAFRRGSCCARHVVKGGLEGEMIALVFAPSAEMIGWCMGVGVKLEGGRGSGSLIWWPSVKPRASAFYPGGTSCWMRWGNALRGWALSKGWSSFRWVSCTLQAKGAFSLFIQSSPCASPHPRHFSFGGEGNYKVNATLNRKRNGVFFKKKKK